MPTIYRFKKAEDINISGPCPLRWKTDEVYGAFRS